MSDESKLKHEQYLALLERVRGAAALRDHPDDEAIQDLIDQVLKEVARERYMPLSERLYLGQRIFNALRRLDLLQPLVDDRTVTEIMINGPDEIYVERQGQIEKIAYAFDSTEQLENVIQTIVGKVNRTVNESNPMVDARLEDGSRIHVVLPPIALKGPTLTIRKFPEKPMTMKDLVDLESIDEASAHFLETLVKARYNLFICGGTGSGKTTFLNVLSNAIPKDQRIITIEDSAELQLTGALNLVSLETRNANVEGKGEISIRGLIKASLRMRPDRIVVGEVRGSEALDMLQAMNTGHDGSLSTGHANSSKDMLIRLETMVLMGGNMPLEAIRQQIGSAIDVIVHLGRLRDKSRKVLEISEVVGCNQGQIVMNPLFHYKEDKNSTDSKVSGSLAATGNKLGARDKLRLARLEKGVIC